MVSWLTKGQVLRLLKDSGFDQIWLEDNEKIYFGSDNDGYIYFDGTDLIIKTDSGDVNLQPAGSDVNVSGNLSVTGKLTVNGAIDPTELDMGNDSPIYLSDDKKVKIEYDSSADKLIINSSRDPTVDSTELNFIAGSASFIRFGGAGYENMLVFDIDGQLMTYYDKSGNVVYEVDANSGSLDLGVGTGDPHIRVGRSTSRGATPNQFYCAVNFGGPAFLIDNTGTQTTLGIVSPNANAIEVDNSIQLKDDVSIKFDTAGTKTLKWDSSNSVFSLNDSLYVDGNISLGNEITYHGTPNNYLYGGQAPGDDFFIRANKADTYPSIQMFGGASVIINAATDVFIDLGDDSGNYRFFVRDNTSVFKFYVDSLGNTYVKGNLSVDGSINKSVAFPILPAVTPSGNQTAYFNYYNGYAIESSAQTKITDGTVTALRVNIYSNSLGGDTTVTLRKNGADTSLTGTIPAGSTGQFEFTGSVSISKDDLIDVMMVIGGNASQSLAIRGGTLLIQIK